jgi:hypothetical protein
VLLFVIHNLNVPLLPFVANETPLKEIYRVNQTFLISTKVLHTEPTQRAISKAPNSVAPQPIHRYDLRSRRGAPPTKRIRRNHRDYHRAYAAVVPIPEAYIPPALNLDIHGKPLTYRSAKNGPDHLVWERAEADELIRLLDTKTIVPIKYSDIPEDRLGDIVYYNPVVKQKRNDDGSIKCRVRGTAGGDRLTVRYDVSARTASLETVKMLIHSIVSSNKKWRTLDIADFYLGAPLPPSRYEYLRINTKMIPDEIMKRYQLYGLERSCFVYFEIRRCMYGLPQAGRLSQIRLIALSTSPATATSNARTPRASSDTALGTSSSAWSSTTSGCDTDPSPTLIS